MNPLLPKVAVGTLALSTIGTGAYFGAKELFKGPTIKEQLAKENFRFIDFDNTGQGDLEFESDSVNIKKAGGDAVNNGDKLRKKCKTIMSSDPEKNKLDIDNVKKGCGIRSISSQLARKNKKFLASLSGTSVEVDKQGKATYDKKKNDRSTRSELGLSGDGPSGDSDEMAEFRRLCGEKGKADYLASAEGTYTVAENGCTVEAATPTVPKV